MISETISGSVGDMNREKFKTLMERRMGCRDKLVVLKLNRQGRDDIDVQNTAITSQ